MQEKIGTHIAYKPKQEIPSSVDCIVILKLVALLFTVQRISIVRTMLTKLS